MMKETTLINQYSLQRLLAENGSVLESYSFSVNDVDNIVDGFDKPMTVVFRNCEFLSTFNLACGWNLTARFENCRFYRPVYFYACPKAEMVKCSFGDNSRFNVTDLLLDSCVFNLLSTSDSLVHGYLVCVYDADSLKIVGACGWPEVSPLNVDSISIKDSDLCGLHTARHSFNRGSPSTISVESSIMKNLHILHQNAMLSLTDTTVDNVRLEHAMVAVPTYSKSSIKKTFAAIESQVKYSDCFTPDCIEYLSHETRGLSKKTIQYAVMAMQNYSINYDGLAAIATELNHGHPIEDTLRDLNLDRHGNSSYEVVVTINGFEYCGVIEDSLETLQEERDRYTVHLYCASTMPRHADKVSTGYIGPMVNFTVHKFKIEMDKKGNLVFPLDQATVTEIYCPDGGVKVPSNPKDGDNYYLQFDDLKSVSMATLKPLRPARTAMYIAR